jgi:4-hydroxyphenylpyruvate dioxygenase-like putative hemolysin
MNSLFEHVEMYVGDARQAALYSTQAFGFKAAKHFPTASRRDCHSVALRQGAIRLIVTSALKPTHPAASYLTLHGDGVADIALRVPNAW